jgi:hypothetical protein
MSHHMQKVDLKTGRTLRCPRPFSFSCLVESTYNVFDGLFDVYHLACLRRVSRFSAKPVGSRTYTPLRLPLPYTALSPTTASSPSENLLLH